MRKTPASAATPGRDKGCHRQTAYRDQLQRVLGSTEFLNAQAPSGFFLRYIVEGSLAGQNGFKEYLIGVEAFDPQRYNQKDNPIVRIEAGRLRKSCGKCCANQGKEHILIEVPKGGYAPCVPPSSAHS